LDGFEQHEIIWNINNNKLKDRIVFFKNYGGFRDGGIFVMLIYRK
jgi:hypothetical protein